jgi:hypothetical protein
MLERRTGLRTPRDRLVWPLLDGPGRPVERFARRQARVPTPPTVRQRFDSREVTHQQRDMLRITPYAIQLVDWLLDRDRLFGVRALTTTIARSAKPERSICMTMPSDTALQQRCRPQYERCSRDRGPPKCAEQERTAEQGRHDAFGLPHVLLRMMRWRWHRLRSESRASARTLGRVYRTIEIGCRRGLHGCLLPARLRGRTRCKPQAMQSLLELHEVSAANSCIRTIATARRLCGESFGRQHQLRHGRSISQRSPYGLVRSITRL